MFKDIPPCLNEELCWYSAPIACFALPVLSHIRDHLVQNVPLMH
jgi:hypothetical protein